MGLGQIIALIKSLGGSGGGSGGGVLVVTDTDGTLDKTWQEIHDASFAILVNESDEYSKDCAMFSYMNREHFSLEETEI